MILFADTHARIEALSNNLICEVASDDYTARDTHGAPLLGFDCEWRIMHHRADVIQLATPHQTCVFQVANLDSLPDVLIALLESKEVRKTGNCIHNDIRQVKRWGVTVPPVGDDAESTLELGHLAKQRGVVPQKRTSLAFLCKTLLGFELPKEQTVRVSEWHESLSEEQIRYAGMDAEISLKCAQTLQTIAI